MCGRYEVKSAPALEQALSRPFAPGVDFVANSDARPTQMLPVITNQDPQLLQLFRWGLVPFWAKDIKIGNTMINAQSETVAEKPAFKSLLAKRRCLVPASAYFEWQPVAPKQKQKYRITTDRDVFCMAGLWDTWKDPTGQLVYSFTIITGGATGHIGEIHDRSPIILPGNLETAWLEGELSPAEILQPYSIDLMQAVTA